MKIDQKILSRLQELIALGRNVLATRHSPPPNFFTSDFVDVQLANQWLTSCQSLLEKVFGSSSTHYKNLTRHYVDYPKWPDVEQAFGVLLAAHEDYERDALFDAKQLIEAELFDDFLEQADHLLEADYYQPAAVIAGSVLEDGLRKLCVRHEIELSEKPKLDWMNAELAKAGVYNKLMQKKITSLADIRNNAAHGMWDEFSKTDVIDMLRDIRAFMEGYYT